MQQSEISAIARTKYLMRKMFDDHESPPFIWFRGIVPKVWQDPPEPPRDVVHNLCNIDPLTWFDRTKAIYLDGSGGSKSRDSGIRRVGWAWCQFFEQVAHQVRSALDSDDISQYGTMSGNESVPWAEL